MRTPARTVNGAGYLNGSPLARAYRDVRATALTLDVVALYRNHTTAYFYMCGPRDDLVELVRLVGAGRIDPVIDSRFPLSDAAGAEGRLAAREQFGKIVLVPDSVLQHTPVAASTQEVMP